MRYKKINVFFVLLLLLNLESIRAQVRLPRLVRDSMILQRDTKINIWGWAAKDEKVNIKFNGKTYKTKTGADGKWLIRITSNESRRSLYNGYCRKQ